MIVPRRLGIQAILLGLNGQIAHFGLCGCFDLATGNAAGNGIGHLTDRSLQVALEGNIAVFINGAAGELVFLAHEGDLTGQSGAVDTIAIMYHLFFTF